MPKKSRRRGGGKKAGRPGGTGNAPTARPAPEESARRNSASVSGGDDTNPSMMAPDALTFQPYQHDRFSEFCGAIGGFDDWHSVEQFCSHPEMFPLVNQYSNRMVANMLSLAPKRTPWETSPALPGSLTMEVCFDLYLDAGSLEEYLDESTLTSRIADGLMRVEKAMKRHNLRPRFSMANVPGFPTQEVGNTGVSYGEEKGKIWPYAKRLELFHQFYDQYLTGCSRRDVIGVRNALVSTLQRPLYQTDGVRVSVLAICLSGADLWFDDKAKTLVKEIAANEEETMAMRATAMLLRAVFLCNKESSFSCTTAVANYLRRADKYASNSSEGEWPPSVSLQNIYGDHFQFDANLFSRGILHEHLDRFGGMLGVSCCEETFHNINYSLVPTLVADDGCFTPHAHSVGGLFCDGCGKHSDNLVSLLKCKQCRLAFYCNAECQAKAWEAGHRDHCKRYGRFQEGDMAILQNLQKAAHLNNHWVRVVGKASSPGRITVHLMCDGKETGTVMAVKKKNLRHHRPLK